jgi:MinD-like ATPase involved in chromosome partitioning or flagellar assembly
MSVQILTAIAEPRWEADLAGALASADVGLQLVRRCVDLAELLAAAAAGLAQAAVVSADLRRLDRDAVARLQATGVAVVGLTGVGDEGAERRLRQLGVDQVLRHDASPTQLAGAVLAAVDGARVPAWPEDLGAAGDLPREGGRDDDPGPEASGPGISGAAAACEGPAPPLGRVVAIWGPVGAPGRSTLSVNLAAELCALGHAVVLIDADTYGGVVAQLLGVLDEAPGLAAACRLANQGVLDSLRLGAVALELRPGLRLLTGIARPDRWLEIRPAAFDVVVQISRRLGAFIVIDCGFCLEQDEELSYDTAAPRRNGATLAALRAADVVLGVAAADPVGLARYVRALPDCIAVVEPLRPLTVANRTRNVVTGPGDPRRAIRTALERYAGLSDVVMVPDDRQAVDAAVAVGRTLREAAPRSDARKAIRELAVRIAAG